MIFIDGQFMNVSFEEKLNQKEIDIEKKEYIVILVQYTQRIYSENFAKLEIKVFDKQQNKLNDINQNYGYVSNTNIEVLVTDEDNQ